ncbi:MAG: DinB family protein [Actinomycetota bacterium]|nr:DinB family protein [Actinomycetota bacterium]
MAERFEFRDLSGAEFWGVDLQRATFRDVDLTGARVSHARLVDVAIDAEIDRLVVNGVDVTAYVNQGDEWYDLRSRVRPADPAAMREAWQSFLVAWGGLIGRAEVLPDERRHASVDGEWSFVQTLRHLVFATDKWFTVPVLGGAFEPIGLPNSGSADFDWPGLDATVEPAFDDAVAAWRDRWRTVGEHLDELEHGALAAEVEVLENGTATVRDCVGVVLEEHFQHLRYATRDLEQLE